MLTGNIVAICFSGLVCIVISLLKPQNFEWALLKEIPTLEEQEEVSSSCSAAQSAQPLAIPTGCALLRPRLPACGINCCPAAPLTPHQVEDAESSPEALTRALHWTYWTGGVLTLVMIIFWPLLAIPAGVFSKGYFHLWVIIAMAWGLVASVCTLVLPIWEARETLINIALWRVPAAPAAKAEYDVKPAA